MDISIRSIFLAAAVLFLTQKLFLPAKRTNAPLIGPTGLVAGFLARFQSFKGMRAWLDEAYSNKKVSVRLPVLLGGDRVLIVKRELVEELRLAEALSMQAASAKALQGYYTVGQAALINPIHVGIVQNQLNNKGLGALFPDMKEELTLSLENEMKDVGSDLIPIKAVNMLMRVIAQTSNRIFVGSPLCRNTEWRDLQVSYTISVIIDAFVINLFPEFMWPVVGRYFTRCPSAVRKATKLLTPLINERLAQSAEDRPNDYLTWVLAEAPKHPGELEPEAITRRVLLANFASVHTSSLTAAQALFDLSILPEVQLKELRDEVESVVEKHGWSKSSIAKMVKLDSFIRESQRLNGISTVSLGRMATQDFTFSDGTFIPKGTSVSAPMHAIHTDSSIYPEPLIFNPFRFSSLPDAERHQIVSTSLNFLPYGHGKTACPGRFLLALELKTLFAMLLLEYDVRTKDGKRPKVNDFDVACLPDSGEEVMFRRRT